MCGIIAIVDERAGLLDIADVGGRMLATQQHRGPDNTGIWPQGPVFLGHNRLSIIDLSAASHQPMTYGSKTITFNGEIYNYLELREELQRDGYSFRTTGDTEVVLASLHRWGHNAVERFIGMWAFAVWDSEERELFCSRDRFGIKPFHYIERSGRLYISSEIKALQVCPLFRGGLNEAQIARGLYMGWMHHWEETYFEDIVALPASHNLLWKNGQIHTWQYAEIDTHTQSSASFEEHSEAFRELFIDSIRLTSRRDVPIGVCLSGGLDSTSIAGVLASATDEVSVKTFTAYYTGTGNVDERPYIQHLLSQYPSIYPSEISPSDRDVQESFDRIVRIMDAPLPSSSYISQYFVMQLAAQNGVKVVLDGQGSDEIMGGYMHVLYRIVADLLRAGRFVEAAAELRSHAARQGYGVRRKLELVAKSILASVRDEPLLYQLEFEHTNPWILKQAATLYPIRVGMPSGTRTNAFLHNLLRVTLLPTLLHTEDINSMAFSIESRVPFLDHRLVDLCFSMPNSHKVHRGVTKRVLRSAMRGIVPDEILDRKDKTGFITPGHIQWLRGDLSYLLDGSWSAVEQFVKADKLANVLSAYKAGSNANALFVWRLAMLRAFLTSR